MNKAIFKILLIEDNPGDVVLIREMLKSSTDEMYDLKDAQYLAQALELLACEKFDVILLDLHLPDCSDEIKTYEKVNSWAGDTPILALTGIHDDKIIENLFHNGIQDYLIKGNTDSRMFRLSIRYAILRTQAARKLQSSEARFRTLVEDMTDTVFIMDKDGIVKFVNPAGEKLFRTSIDEFVGEQFGFPVMQDKSAEIELFGWTEDPIITEMRTVETDWEGKPAWLASMRDITSRKQMEAAMEKTSRELKRSVLELEASNRKILAGQTSLIEEERLKVLLQMAGTTAHELNQPLSVLLGNVEILSSLADDPEGFRDCLKDIETAGRKMARIVKKIQSIRKYETRPYADGKSIIRLEQSLRILSVEDSDDDFKIIEKALADNFDISLVRVRSIAKAREKIKNQKFDLVFLDYILPDGDAFSLSDLLHGKNTDLPVIIITGQGNEIIASRLIREGAYDYIPKDRLSGGVLNRSIGNTLEKVRLKREIKHMQDKIRGIAVLDNLTGLHNRRYFEEKVGLEMEGQRRYGHQLALVMMDLDNLSQINETHGYRVGNMILRDVGMMIGDAFRVNDTACRYSGDSFAAIFTHLGVENARLVCERLRKKLSSHRFNDGELDFQVTISMGLTPYDIDHDKLPKDLIERAQKALIQAGHEGGNRVILVQA